MKSESNERDFENYQQSTLSFFMFFCIILQIAAAARDPGYGWGPT
jgi:hypothetical protein